jgi:hypothetical protein
MEDIEKDEMDDLPSLPPKELRLTSNDAFLLFCETDLLSEEHITTILPSIDDIHLLKRCEESLSDDVTQNSKFIAKIKERIREIKKLLI